MSIVVVGTVAFDSIETPAGRVERAIGGSATYFSLAASYFTRIRLVAVVGEDFGLEHRKILHEKNVDLEGLVAVRGGKTFYWAGRYGEDPNERETLVTELNVFESFRPQLPPSYRSSEWLFLGNIDPEIQMDVLDQVEGSPYVGCDTMNYWIQRKPRELESVLKRVDILFINDGEAREMSGEKNLVSAANAVLARGPRALVIKRGEHGAILFTKDFRFFAPAYPLEEVMDPTGAGDSFAGGFMGYLARSSSLDPAHLRRAMYYGTIMASYACQSFSVEGLRRLSEKHITGRFEELVELVRVEPE
jgi:sugar/nucleoside kinase (ribokinase family)